MSEADLFLQGGKILNVYSGEILKMNVAVRGRHFQYVGPLSSMVGEKTRVLDVSDKILVPGYVEPHCHPWLLYNPLSFAREAAPRGTTTFVCDNLIFFMLMGVETFESFMTVLMDGPVKLFWFCRAVPQTPMKDEEILFSVENVSRLLKHPAAASLGEITRWQALANGHPKILALIEAAKKMGKRVDGHTAGAKFDKLNTLTACGVESCHESITAQEVLDRLRLGLYVILRESSLRQDLRELISVVRNNGLVTDRMMLTIDASAPAFHDETGYTDHLIRIALEEGVDPIEAYRMVTINPAVYFRMEQRIGGIAPGRDADILVLEDLSHPMPETVISKGRIIAEGGELREEIPEPEWERFLPKAGFSPRPWHAEASLFTIGCKESEISFPVIKLITPVITRTMWTTFPVRNGLVDLSEHEECCFIALSDREGRWITNGILQGMGDGIEGLVSSFNTATQILAIGRDPAAMALAVNRVLELKGGIVVVENGKTAFELPLPLGGMMSGESMGYLADRERSFKAFLSRRGYPFHDPLYTLVFLPNDFLPEVRINYRGVVDIKKGKTLWERRDLIC